MDLQFSASQIAQLINCTVEVENNVMVNMIARIEDAVENQMAFFSNPKYEEFLYNTKASIILINNDFVAKSPIPATLIRVDDAYESFAQLLQIYEQMVSKKPVGIEPNVHQGKNVTINENAYIGAFTYLSDGVTIGKNAQIYPQVFLGTRVLIGDNVTLHPGVKIYNNCRIGNNVIIHAGSIIGSDGFGFAPTADGSLKKIPQLGNVIIEDDVEIGSNCTIDRATLGSTIIHKGAKLDNLIQIGHNVEVGDQTVIAAQSGVGGSTKIGKRNMIGGQAGITGHITTANGTKINAQSGVSKSVKQENISISGTPAYDFTSNLKAQAIFRKLPLLEKQILALEKEIEALKISG
jgi:UDP-3-O-[3-hydroxymyristoyl] glucosamine N-acyltransferase